MSVFRCPLCAILAACGLLLCFATGKVTFTVAATAPYLCLSCSVSPVQQHRQIRPRIRHAHRVHRQMHPHPLQEYPPPPEQSRIGFADVAPARMSPLTADMSAAATTGPIPGTKMEAATTAAPTIRSMIRALVEAMKFYVLRRPQNAKARITTGQSPSKATTHPCASWRAAVPGYATVRQPEISGKDPATRRT